jgi:hypothetical protein
VSETGEYTAVAFEYIVRVYKNNFKSKKVEEISCFEAKTNASKAPIISLSILEKAKIIVFTTGGKNNTLYVTKLDGT